QRAITVPLSTWITDEAFFRHVELATQPPDVSALEISRGVFRGHRDGTDCLASILAALQLPGALPHGPLGETRGFVAQHWQKRHGLAATSSLTSASTSKSSRPR